MNRIVSMNVKDLKEYFKKVDVILTVLVVLDILFILAAFLFNLSEELIYYVILFDTVICIALIIHFLIKLRRSGNKIEFSAKYWLDLIASLPFGLLVLYFLPNALFTYNVIVLVRFLNLILLLKVISKFVEKFLDATYLDKIIAIFVTVLLASTLALYFFDPNITSVFDAIWFIFQTITTVGYGDIIPASPIGKFVGLLLLIAGVLMFSIFTASMAYLFNKKVFSEENEEFIKSGYAIRDNVNETRLEIVKKVGTLKDNFNEARLEISEIKEKVDSNDEELQNIDKRLDDLEENMNNLSRNVDRLIEILEKKD